MIENLLNKQLILTANYQHQYRGKTDEIRQAVQADPAHGEQIIRESGLPQSSQVRLRNEFDIHARRGQPRSENWLQAEEDIFLGGDIGEIAERHGMSFDSVRNIARRLETEGYHTTLNSPAKRINTD